MLEPEESLSAFVESAVVRQIEFRKMQKEFIARGLVAKQASHQSGKYVSGEESLLALDAILEKHPRQE